MAVELAVPVVSSLNLWSLTERLAALPELRMKHSGSGGFHRGSQWTGDYRDADVRLHIQLIESPVAPHGAAFHGAPQLFDKCLLL